MRVFSHNHIGLYKDFNVFLGASQEGGYPWGPSEYVRGIGASHGSLSRACRDRFGKSDMRW